VFDSTSDGVAIALTAPTKGKPSRLEAPERYLDLIKP
jgi:hypothetical protein